MGSVRFKPLAIAILVYLSFPVTATATADGQQSTATITFEANNNITPPVNPDNPGEGSGESGTDMLGPLSIDYISELAFGEGLSISSLQQIYNTTTVKPHIQVTDNRGTGAGWKVTAKMGSFRKDGADTLNGSYITLLNGSPISVNMTLAPPVAEQSVVLRTDNVSAPVISAQAGAGMGTWVNRWYPATGDNTYVTLTVPGGTATTGAHTATITWELTNAP